MNEVAEQGVAQIASMTPAEFSTEIPRKWNAVEKIVHAITERVQEAELTPLEGYKLIGCAVAETFGYRETHGSFLTASPLEVIGLLGAFRGGTSR